MQGKLILNLEPAYMCFTSDTNLKRSRSCRAEDIRDFLIEMKIWGQCHTLPRDFFVSLYGDFPAEVLSKFGLARLVLLEDLASKVAS